MVSYKKNFFALCVMCFLGAFSTYSYAQFLPDNSTLNVQSVQRWMQSNRDFAGIVQALDELYKNESELKKFEALPPAEQDQKITMFLQQKKLLESTNKIAIQHGWKSLGEYVRLSTKLGNAIAAHFFNEKAVGLNEEQKKAMREQADPAVLNVPAADVAFVKTNEKLLQAYIQAYAKGR